YVESVGTARMRTITSVDQTPKMVNDDTWDLGLYGLTTPGLDPFVAGFPATAPPGEAFHHPPGAEAAAVLAEPSDFSIDATRELLRDHTLRDWRDTVRRAGVPVLAIGATYSPLW